MNRLEQIIYLRDELLKKMPQYKAQTKMYKHNEFEQEIFLHSLMNLRCPSPISDEFLKVQNQYLQAKLEEKGIVKLSSLQPIEKGGQIYLFEGDICRLDVDAIVNSANNTLLGCFLPGNRSVDNTIHLAAGLELREECHQIMLKQGYEEEIGKAKLTLGYNLPSKYVIHTVGPKITTNRPSPEQAKLLASSYRSSLELAIEKDFKSIAFSSISTGQYRYPHLEAAEIAYQTIQEVLAETKSKIKVIFVVYQKRNLEAYQKVLKLD